MSTLRPKNIKVDRRQRILIIEWEDDHISIYPFDGLRAVCPCVECRGGHQNMGQIPHPRVLLEAQPTTVNILNASAVGSYAIQFEWSDNHWTGIYNWEFLRAICPCEICFSE